MRQFRPAIKCYVMIPHDLEQGKVLGSLIFGPTMVRIRGNYDDVNRLCTEIADKYGWAIVNVNLRPYYTEGAKTYGFEIAEQLRLETAAAHRRARRPAGRSCRRFTRVIRNSSSSVWLRTTSQRFIPPRPPAATRW